MEGTPPESLPTPGQWCRPIPQSPDREIVASRSYCDKPRPWGDSSRVFTVADGSANRPIARDGTRTPTRCRGVDMRTATRPGRYHPPHVRGDPP